MSNSLTPPKPPAPAAPVSPAAPAVLPAQKPAPTTKPADPISKLNEDYFIVDVGMETVVGQEIEVRDKARKWTEFRFRGFEDFKKKLIKQIVKVGDKPGTTPPVPIYKPLADVWLRHRNGRQYDRLVYAPPGSTIVVNPKDINGWKGFTVEPAPGDWSMIRDILIKQIICDHNPILFEYTMDWIADMFQRPGVHAETALIFIGTQGTGKNFFTEIVLGRTFDGRHFRSTTHTKQVLGEFNDVLSGLCMLVLDEAGLQSQQEYSAVKGLITGHQIDINRKGIRIDSENSMLHCCFLSNLDVPLKVSADDRRFVFYAVNEMHKNDTVFFARLAKCLDEEGGRAAMLYELLNRKVDRDKLRVAPTTAQKEISRRESWTPVQWFFFRMLRDAVDSSGWGNMTDRNGQHLRRLKKSEVAAAYQNYITETNNRRIIQDPRTELHNELKKIVPADWDFNRVVKEGGIVSREYWTLPDWDVFTSSFAAGVGCSIRDLLAEEHEGGTRPVTLTESEAAFASRDAEGDIPPESGAADAAPEEDWTPPKPKPEM